MKELVVGDIHLSANPRDEYRHDFQKWLRKTARTIKPDRIVLLGDLTEQKDRHPAVLVNRVVDHVYKLARIAPVICLPGNHDYREEGRAFFEFLSRIPNTIWVKEPMRIDDGLFLPHTPDYRRDWKHIDFQGIPFLYFHATFSGADLGNGVEARDGIPVGIIPKQSVALCGDVHVPQETRSLVYVGAPYTVDFGDSYQSSIIHRTGSIYNRVDTSHLAQKRTFHITTGDTDLRNQFFNAGDICQITVDVDDMGGWLPLRDGLKEDAEKRGLKVWAIKPKLIARAVRRQHKIRDNGSDRELLDTYAKRMGLTEHTIKAGLKLL
jgi:hypothetical protein